MAKDPRTYRSAAIIVGVFSLVALFGGIAIPLIEKSSLRSQIISDQMLTREQSLTWGAVPGTRNTTYQKTFTVFSLNADSEQILKGTLDATPITTATYNYSYQYSSLEFAPYFNGSVQFQNTYNHTFMGDNEDALKNLMVSTVNIGAFRGVTQQADMSPAQTFVQSLYRIYTSFQANIVNLLLSDYVHQFYLNNKTLADITIFKYQNTIPDDEIADRLWNDPDYGWSQSSTLLPWINLATQYKGTPTPQYTMLKNRFGLTDNQMNALIGSTPGQYSMLFLLITMVQSTIAAENMCALSTGCTVQELFALQFFQANITRNPAFEGIPPRDSIADINETYPLSPEIAAVNPNNVYFEAQLANELFNVDGNLPANTQHTLFGIQNVEMILNNQNNTDAITQYFGLDNGTGQAQVLIDYVNYIINEFAYQGQTNLKTAKYTADIAVTNMNNLAADMASLISVNLTAIGTYNWMLDQNQTCESLLQAVQSVTLNQSVIDGICNSPDFTLSTAHGQASWVAAFYSDDSDLNELIQSETGIDASDIQYVLATDDTSLFGTYIQDVTNAMAAELGCGQGLCDNTLLFTLQWSTSNVTKQLPGAYFNYESFDSLADIPDFKDYFGNFIPELPVFAKRTLGVDMGMTVDKGNNLLGYNPGSLNNNYEVLKLISMAQSGNYSGIQDRFGFNKDQLNAVFTYFDSAFMDYYMGGLVQTVSAYDLLWGYNDTFLTNLNSTPFFDNLQLFNPQISLLGDKDNSDDSSDSGFSMINSGAYNSQDVRKMTAYNGNSTLSLNKTYFDGNNYYSTYVLAWGGDLQYISGTDGSGFAPLLDQGTPITIFEGPFLRDLKYNYQTTITKEYNDKEYDFNQYQLDTSQLGTSSTYYNTFDGYMNLTGFDYTPIVVSLPYYKACAADSYSSITFNGKSASSYQSAIDQGTVTVEALTGITDSFTKSYQYNIYNMMPFFLTKQNNLAAIPLFQVEETYSTPFSDYETDLRAYYARSHSITVAMIVVLVIAFLMMVTSAVLFRLYWVNKNKLNESRINGNIVGFSSLGVVESDGARSSLHPLTETLHG